MSVLTKQKANLTVASKNKKKVKKEETASTDYSSKN